MSPEQMTIRALNDELAGAVTNLASYHTLMQRYIHYYENSAFYPRKAGERVDTTELSDNYLQIFADKNIHYTSEMPEIKIIGQPEERENANMREKILYAVHRKSGTALLWKKWARDGTKKSMAASEVIFDLNERCARVKRHDPRHIYWKMSNGDDGAITAAWIIYPITKTEAMQKYGVEPTKDTVSFDVQVRSDPWFNHMDGQEWFTMAIRLDDKYRVAWIGDKIIEEPHEHMMGVIPIDICAPFPSEEKNQPGEFYLKKLITMQAELNDTVRRRSNIVKRMSNPILWGRNIQARSYDDVKNALKNAETGVLGLGKDGEVGILQLQEIKMLYEHEAALKSDMQRLSGFAAASFGESVGANTSGDALGMYFTPTQKHIDDQYISWKAFLESINAKILRLYDVFGRTGEQFWLDGYAPRSTVLTATDGGGYEVISNGDGKFGFTREVINGNYNNRVIPPAVIPKNELAEKQFWATAAKDKIISRNTAYEKLGLESPEDEKQQLLLEQYEPILNPEGVGSILQNIQQPAAPQIPPPPQVTPQV